MGHETLSHQGTFYGRDDQLRGSRIVNAYCSDLLSVLRKERPGQLEV